METIKIIKLAPDEWQTYKKIRLEALRVDPQAFGSSYQETLLRPDAFWQGRLAEAAGSVGDSAADGNPAGQKSWLIFARQCEQIVGTVGAYHQEDAPSGEEGTAHIIGVYVTPSARGKRIASALMEALLQEISSDSSIRRLVLGVNIQQAAALALYRRFGFEITDTVTVRMGDGKEHEQYVMERIIGA